VNFHGQHCGVVHADLKPGNVMLGSKRLLGDPIAPRKINPHIAPQAEENSLWAMQRYPPRRYPTAAAMQADLDDPGSGPGDRLV